MPHAVLLGDSIFDNASYVAGGPDVVTHLRRELPSGWEATLAAVDGATTGGVPSQLRRIPDDATHLVLSVGGNDALMNIGVLDRPARSMAEALDMLATLRDGFHRAYAGVVEELRGRGLPLVICTIYNGNLGDERTQRLAQTALTMYNDVILQTAAEHGLGCIELRQVCSDPGDYANPIEPSVQGGGKIARAIARAVSGDGERCGCLWG